MMIELVKIGMTCVLMVIPCAAVMFITDDYMRFENRRVFCTAIILSMCFITTTFFSLAGAAIIGIWTGFGFGV